MPPPVQVIVTGEGEEEKNEISTKQYQTLVKVRRFIGDVILVGDRSDPRIFRCEAILVL